MCDTGYSIKQLVFDLQALKVRGVDEATMVARVPLLAQRLVGCRHNWLRPSMCVPNSRPGDGAAIHTLHEEPDHSLAVFVVTWAPGDETPPHDHQTWAVIAGLEGSETNHWWERIDDGTIPGHAQVRRAGRQTIDATRIASMPGDAIHSLHNDSSGLSITLHLYGMNVDHTDRHRFDPERHTLEPYRLGGTTNAVPTRRHS